MSDMESSSKVLTRKQRRMKSVPYMHFKSETVSSESDEMQMKNKSMFNYAESPPKKTKKVKKSKVKKIIANADGDEETPVAKIKRRNKSSNKENVAMGTPVIKKKKLKKESAFDVSDSEVALKHPLIEEKMDASSGKKKTVKKSKKKSKQENVASPEIAKKKSKKSKKAVQQQSKVESESPNTSDFKSVDESIREISNSCSPEIPEKASVRTLLQLFEQDKMKTDKLSSPLRRSTRTAKLISSQKINSSFENAQNTFEKITEVNPKHIINKRNVIQKSPQNKIAGGDKKKSLAVTKDDSNANEYNLHDMFEHYNNEEVKKNLNESRLSAGRLSKVISSKIVDNMEIDEKPCNNSENIIILKSPGNSNITNRKQYTRRSVNSPLKSKKFMEYEDEVFKKSPIQGNLIDLTERLSARKSNNVTEKIKMFMENESKEVKSPIERNSDDLAKLVSARKTNSITPKIKKFMENVNVEKIATEGNADLTRRVSTRKSNCVTPKSVRKNTENESPVGENLENSTKRVVVRKSMTPNIKKCIENVEKSPVEEHFEDLTKRASQKIANSITPKTKKDEEDEEDEVLEKSAIQGNLDDLTKCQKKSNGVTPIKCKGQAEVKGKEQNNSVKRLSTRKASTELTRSHSIRKTKSPVKNTKTVAVIKAPTDNSNKTPQRKRVSTSKMATPKAKNETLKNDTVVDAPKFRKISTSKCVTPKEKKRIKSPPTESAIRKSSERKRASGDFKLSNAMETNEDVETKVKLNSPSRVRKSIYTNIVNNINANSVDYINSPKAATDMFTKVVEENSLDSGDSPNNETFPPNATFESASPNTAFGSGSKKKSSGNKRNTFELKPEDSYLQSVKAKTTFELEPEESFIQSGKRRTLGELDSNKKVHVKGKSNLRKNVVVNLFNAELDSQTPPWHNVTDDAKLFINDSCVNLKMSQKRVVINTPPSGASTPFTGKFVANRLSNASKLKSSLKKPPVAKGSGVQDSSKTISKTYVRTKLPNFVKIRKHALDKLESVEDHANRKAERAKLLLSGCKVAIGLPKNGSEKKVSRISTKVPSPKKTVASAKKTVGFAFEGMKTPKRMMHSRLATPAKVIVPPMPVKKPSPVKPNFTRFGFKVRKDDKSSSKENVIKAVVQKTRIERDAVKDRRNVIQGVRSNRRFDLLMKLRQNT